MNLKINGKNVTKSLAEVVELLYGEINGLREELKQVQSSLMVADEKLNSKLKKIAEQVDKITVHLNQEGSVVGW
jgi:deoxyribodipyrimidine photolyase